MWQSQILISEFEPCVTGPEPLTRFLEQLSGLRDVDEMTGRLVKLQELLRYPGKVIGIHQAIEKELFSLGITSEGSDNVLQMDLSLQMQESKIDRSLVEGIVLQASDLLAIGRENKNPDLEKFKTRFQDRYDEEEIPINIALDADTGIGYAGVTDDAAGNGELINGLAAGLPAKGRQTHVDPISEFILNKYQDFLKTRKQGIDIKEEELTEKLKKQTDKYVFPNSMFLMGNLLKKDGKLDADHFLFDLFVFGGPSAANLFGRFTHSDKELCRATRQILAEEEREHADAIYAEIVHLPQARTGNVLLRPLLRSYEIPYVGRSGPPGEPDHHGRYHRQCSE